MRDRFGETQMYVRWQKAEEEQKRFDKAKRLSWLASRDHPAALYPLRHMTSNPEIIPDGHRLGDTPRALSRDSQFPVCEFESRPVSSEQFPPTPARHFGFVGLQKANVATGPELMPGCRLNRTAASRPETELLA